MEWVRNNKLVLIGAIMVAVFISFVFMGRGGSSGNQNSTLREVNSASPMSKGDKNAKVSLIQYSDFLCPSCSYFSTQVMPTIQKDYIDTGKVKFEFRPMAFIALGSTQAGEGAYCAVEQDKFWAYHDAIYTYVADKVFNKGLNPQVDLILSPDIIKQIASSVGLQPTTFDGCLDSGTHQADITASTQAANRSGITSTPYVLVNGQHVSGNPTLQTVEALIKAAL